MTTAHDPAATASPAPTSSDLKAVMLGLDLGEQEQIGLAEDDQHLLLYASEATRSAAITKLFLGAAAREARVGVIDLSGGRGSDYHHIKPFVRLAYDPSAALTLMANAYSLSLRDPQTETWLFVDGLHTMVMPGMVGDRLPADLDPELLAKIEHVSDVIIGAFWTLLRRLLDLGNVHVVVVMRGLDFVALSKLPGARNVLNGRCARIVVDGDSKDHHLAFLHERDSRDLLTNHEATFTGGSLLDLRSSTLLIEHCGTWTAELGTFVRPGVMSIYSVICAPLQRRWA